MTAPKKTPVRRRPTPKPAGVVAAEVVEKEQESAEAVTVFGIEFSPSATPIGHGIAVEVLAAQK